MPTVLANPQTEAWDRGVERTVAAVGAMNRAVAELVDTIGMLIDTSGWVGVSSIDQWVCWNANMSKHRAHGLVRIARRRDELPACWAAFREGRLTEDALVRIATRVPSAEDETAARWGVALTIAQLSRVLSEFPLLPDPDPNATPNPSDPQRYHHSHTQPNGWVKGQYSLPPDEGAVFNAAMSGARDAEYRDRKGLEADAELPVGAARLVDNVDAFARLSREAVDGLDATLQRTGYRGERFQVVLHQDVGPDGELGPGRIHLGGHIPDALTRYWSCDANVIHELAKQGHLIGITPQERTPNRRERRYLERRDGGCAHPLCDAGRWLHAHHILHWENGGPTIPSNLVCLCPSHHRALHHGDFTITGDPEAGTLQFTDRWGRPIVPPVMGADPPPPPSVEPMPFVRPYGEPLRTRDWIWN